MILVDIEMPKACNECWLYNEDMECCIVASGGTANRFGYNNSTKPDWCPIKAEIPDNATNGDVIKTMFPDLIMPLSKSSNIVHTRFGDRVQDFDKKWWNAPYKPESEDKECK